MFRVAARPSRAVTPRKPGSPSASRASNPA